VVHVTKDRASLDLIFQARHRSVLLLVYSHIDRGSHLLEHLLGLLLKCLIVPLFIDVRRLDGHDNLWHLWLQFSISGLKLLLILLILFLFFLFLLFLTFLLFLLGFLGLFSLLDPLLFFFAFLSLLLIG